MRQQATDLLLETIHPLSESPADLDGLLDCIGQARIALIGEASHGTQEFYRYRAMLTKRLIVEKGFTAVAVEADWPDAHRVHRYVTGQSRDVTGLDALADFTRFPLWMWRNTEVLGFVAWLHAHNAGLHRDQPRVGFYGLDLYSLHASIHAVLTFLETADPQGAKRARERYSCFDHFGRGSEAGFDAIGLGLSAGCEEEAISQLIELRRLGARPSAHDQDFSPDEIFFAEQNARLIKNAERYYRNMFHAVSSWNLRDHHMAETLEALIAHLTKQSEQPKIVVWEHNSHLGDARATQMGHAGEVNVGQLVRERHGSDARLIGFTTYTGTVTAASDWNGEMERKSVRPALRDSYESLFHEVGVPSFFLSWDDNRAADCLRERRLERAIGVVYRPESERISHYFYANLPEQFDAVIHLDRTTAVTPLDRPSGWVDADAPETYPSGL
ncbi:MAG TPA: erythromycin esterase family protein [Nitrospiraceae bacterium]|nr:erythromycin esterase family protein [Nitrospiraceae bacterium]